MRAFTSRKSDQEMGMPDVEQELARLRAGRKGHSLVKGSRREHLSPLRKVAAILVAALMLTGLSYAAVRTSFFTKSWEAPTSSTQRDTVLKAPATSSREQESSPSGELERGCILFKDVRLDSILMQIDPYYKVESRLTDNELRKIRLLFKWQKQHSLDEVLQRLNGFERFQIRREENTLIVEQSKAEQQSR